MIFTHRGVHETHQLAQVRSAITRFGERSADLFFLAENSVMQGAPEAEAFLDRILEHVRQEDARNYIIALQDRLGFVRSFDGFPEIFNNEQLMDRLYARTGYAFFPAETKTPKLLVVFTTMYNNYQMSNALMYAMLKPFGVNVLFLKDETYFTYLNGVVGLGSDIRELARGIQSFAAEHGYSEIYITGFSSGGFASLYAASLIPCAGYLGLAIYTDISLGSQLPRRLRLAPQIERKIADSAAGIFQCDLKPIVVDRVGGFPIALHYGDLSLDDCAHAQHLAGLPGVRITVSKNAGHGLVGDMMQQHMLHVPFRELLGA